MEEMVKGAKALLDKMEAVRGRIERRKVESTSEAEDSTSLARGHHHHQSVQLVLSSDRSESSEEYTIVIKDQVCYIQPSTTTFDLYLHLHKVLLQSILLNLFWNTLVESRKETNTLTSQLSTQDLFVFVS